MAAAAEVNIETLRYYERRGLLDAPTRSRSGYRTWPPEAVRVVRFVKRAQDVGFTLADIEELLHLADGGPQLCEDTQAVARARIAELDTRIADLTSMRNALHRLLASCDQPRHRRECPMPQALAPDPNHTGSNHP